jgi:hypothetical protein
MSLQSMQARVFLSNESGAGALRPVSTDDTLFIVTTLIISFYKRVRDVRRALSLRDVDPRVQNQRLSSKI